MKIVHDVVFEIPVSERHEGTTFQVDASLKQGDEAYTLGTTFADYIYEHSPSRFWDGLLAQMRRLNKDG